MIKCVVDVEQIYQYLINLMGREFEKAILGMMNVVFEEERPQKNNQYVHDD